MDNSINAHCSICGVGYHICDSCAEQKTFKPWRSVTDTIEHYKIYMAIHGYTISKDKELAKQELQECDLSELENFNPEIKAIISEIMSNTKKKKNASKKDQNETNIVTENINFNE